MESRSAAQPSQGTIAPELTGVLNELELCRYALEEILADAPSQAAKSPRLIEIQKSLCLLDNKYRREDLSAFYPQKEMTVLTGGEQTESQRTNPLTPPPRGQAVLHETLESCYELIDEIVGREEVAGPQREEEEVRRAEGWGFTQSDVVGFRHLRNSFKSSLQILRSLKSRGGYTEEDLRRNAEQLHELEQKFNNFLEKTKAKSPDTFDRLQEPPLIETVMNRCYRTLRLLYDRTEVDPKLEPLYVELQRIKDCLRTEGRKLNQKGGKRGHVDKRKIQEVRKKLSEIENKNRKGGVFVPEANVVEGQTKEVLKGQAILNELLDSCYESMRKFELSSA